MVREPDPPAEEMKELALLSKRQLLTIRLPRFCSMETDLASPKWMPEIVRLRGAESISCEKTMLLANPLEGLTKIAPLPTLLPIFVRNEDPVPVLESVPVKRLLAPGLTTLTWVMLPVRPMACTWKRAPPVNWVDPWSR